MATALVGMTTANCSINATSIESNTLHGKDNAYVILCAQLDRGTIPDRVLTSLDQVKGSDKSEAVSFFVVDTLQRSTFSSATVIAAAR